MTEPTPTGPSNAPQKKSNKTPLIITAMAIVIIFQAVKIYLDARDKSELRLENTTIEKEYATTLQRLEELSSELDERIAEIEKLGGDITELQQAKEEIQAELQRQGRANGRVIAELKDRVEGYELLLKNKDEEIRSEEHTSELQSRENLVCRLLL